MKKTLLLLLLLPCLNLSAQNWVTLSSGVTDALIVVSAPSPTICYAAGANGVILKTTNGGTSWVPQSSGTTSVFYGMWFTSLTTGYAVGSNGAAVRTTNGGMTWTPMSITSNDLRCIWFLDATTGFATGGISTSLGSVYKTTDGGNSWTDLNINAPNVVYGVYFTSATDGYACEYNGTIYKTTNGGASWITPATSGYVASLARLFFVSASTGFYCAGNGKIGKTTNSGASWTIIPSGTTEEHSGIHFLDANNGFIAGGNAGANTGRILRTTDNGASWTTSFTHPGARLCGVFYADATTAYAVGLNGAILKWSTPSSTGLDARFTSSEPGCLGQLENFYSVASGTAGITHSWNFGNGSTPTTSSLADPAGVVYSTAGAKLVTHIVSNGLLADTVTNIITINPSPVAAFSVKATACVDELLTFTNTSGSSPGVTYAWDFGAAAIPQVSTGESPQGIVYKSSGTKTISLTVTNQYGCATTVEQNIVINTLPLAAAGPDKAICSGTTVQIGTTATSGHTYSWQPAGTLNSAVLANPTASPVNPLTTYILTVTTVSTGCKNMDSVDVTVNPAALASFTSNAPACEGSAVDFVNTGSSGAGVIYSWDFGKGAYPALATSQHPKGVLFSSPGNKTITLTVTNQYGCATTTTQALLINQLPTTFAGLDTTICPSTSVQLGKLPDGGLSYTWFPSSTLTNKNISNPVASPIAPVTDYILTATDITTGCKNHDTVTVTMLDYLKANAGVDGEICRYNNFQLGTGLVKGQTYSWSPVKGLNNPALPNPVANPDSTTIYTLTVTANGCTAITDNVTLIVHQLPLADAGPDDTLSRGASIQLNAKGGMQYSWLPETGLNNSGIYNPVANPRQTTSYTVTVTDIFGCVNKDTLLLTVLTPHFWVPTAFTPDGNGISDIFYVRGEDITNFECIVFNRFGEQIFTSKSIETGWDGRRQNGGEDLPSGAYVYHIQGTLSNGEVVNTTGLINLIR